MTKTIYAQTSTRILKEIPRFFGGFQSALAELFQNAYRAGAESVIVKYDKENRLFVISDDGPGLSDPQKLITAGDTGWNENNIVEPAGLGAFSVLRPEFVESVEYQSQGAGNWTMTLTPEVLAGKPIEVTELPNPDGRKGLTIILRLAEKQEVTEENIREARALYPFNVTLLDDEGIKTVEPYKELDPLISIQTPVGQIDWAKSCSYSGWNKVVWEYRPLSSRAFEDALYRAQDKNAHPKLAKALFTNYTNFVWVIDPTSGVRAKLPDRNDLIAGIELDTAAQQIVDNLVDKVIADVQSVSVNWPERIPGGYYITKEEIPETGIKWLDEILHGNRRSIDLLHACLEAIGWYEIEFENMEHVVQNDRDEDGFDVDGDLERNYYKKPQFVTGSKVLSFTLNNLGHPTFQEKGAPDPKVEVKGLKPSPMTVETMAWNNSTRNVYASPWIILADEITVEGVGKVPYLLNYHDNREDITLGELVGDISIDDMDNLSIIFAGTPAECINAINHDDILRNLVAVNCNHSDWNYDWEDGEEDNREVDWDQITSDLEVQVMKAFAPAVADKREYMYTLDSYETELTKLIQEISSLKVKVTNSTKQDATLSLDSAFNTLDATASLIDRDISRRVAELRRETELT